MTSSMTTKSKSIVDTNDIEDLTFSNKHNNNNKVMETPSTIATTSTIHERTTNLTMTTMSKENKKNQGWKNSRNEIFARWKREEEESLSRPKMRDVTNNTDRSSVVQIQSTKMEQSGVSNNCKRDFEIDHVMRSKQNNQFYAHEEKHKASGGDYKENDDDDDTVEHDSSVITTPTANTVLNSVGLDRLINRNDGVKRLFPNSHQKVPNEISSQKGKYTLSAQSPDVSLITQDTTFQHVDLESILEEVEKEKEEEQNEIQLQKPRNMTNRVSMKTSDSDSGSNVENALNALVSKLHRSRVTIKNQEQEIAKQDHRLLELVDNHEKLQNDFENYRSVVKDSVVALVDQMASLQSMIDPESDACCESSSEAVSENLENIVRSLKKVTAEQFPALVDAVSSKSEELRLVQKKVTEGEDDLNNTLAELQNVNKEKLASEQRLNDLNTTITSKKDELSEIEAICDKRIQSALLTEKRLALMEQRVKSEQEELDDNRIAWEAHMQLKVEEVEKKMNKVEDDRKEIMLLSDSLDSSRLELDEQRKDISSIQDEVNKMEAECKEREKILVSKEKELEKIRDELDLKRKEIKSAEDELTESCLYFEDDRNEFLCKVSSLEKDKKDFELERDHFMERVHALEKKESEFDAAKKQFSKRLSNFKLTVKTFQDDASKKRKELDEKANICCQEAERILDKEKKLDEYRLKLENSYISLEEMITRTQEAEAKLVSIKEEKTKLQQTIEALEETRKVKESTLLEVEMKVSKEKKDWDQTLSIERFNLDKELKQQREEFELEVKNLSKHLQCKNDTISLQLTERADQLELLHDQLLKLKFDIESRMSKLLEDELTMQRSRNLAEEEKALKEMEQKLTKQLEGVQRKDEESQRERQQIDIKKKSLSEMECKLKEFAQILKKQGKEMKQRDKDIHHAAKLLSIEKSKRNSDYDQLKAVVKEEQEKNKELLFSLKKLEEDMNIKEEKILQLTDAQQKSVEPVTRTTLRTLAEQLESRNIQLQKQEMEWEVILEEKEAKLSQERKRLDEKIAKLNECESRLTTWQKNLEAYATDITNQRLHD